MEFGEIEIGGSPEVESFEATGELRAAAEHFIADAEKGFDAPGGALADEEEEAPAAWGEEAEPEDEEESAFDLPMMSFDADDSEEEEGAELPMMSFDDEAGVAAAEGEQEAEEPEEEEAMELPTFDLGDDAGADEVGEELPLMASGDSDDGDELAPPFETSAPAAAVEDAYEEAAAEAPAPAKAPEPPKAKKEEPAVPEGGYVDFGAMILGSVSDKKTTRFKVAYEEPSGDEEADFAKMLSQFKEKVSENIEAGDVRAHYDLGTAYKEMGLLQEAISAFQAALRASADHLPTYEVMGQTFIEMGQPDAAVRTLQRALKVQSGVEDELVGIYYYMARAYEALDKKESAVEFYDRVFSLDINFADVTERLRELR
jgi:tetratricopeptide (TPR) repeat protein